MAFPPRFLEIREDSVHQRLGSSLFSLEQAFFLGGRVPSGRKLDPPYSPSFPCWSSSPLLPKRFFPGHDSPPNLSNFWASPFLLLSLPPDCFDGLRDATRGFFAEWFGLFLSFDIVAALGRPFHFQTWTPTDQRPLESNAGRSIFLLLPDFGCNFSFLSLIPIATAFYGNFFYGVCLDPVSRSTTFYCMFSFPLFYTRNLRNYWSSES